MRPAKISALLLAGGCAITLAATVPAPPSNICIDGVCKATISATAGRAMTGAAFVDSIGVNVHFAQAGTPYVTSFPLVKSKLIELGITHLRDGAVDWNGGFSDQDQAALFRELGTAGVHVAFIFDADVSREFVQGFPARVAPAFEAYEFPNESNSAPGNAWVQTLRSWAPTFQAYVRGTAATARWPIIGPSLTIGDDPFGALGDLSPYMDFGNMHAYYSSRSPATEGWGGGGKAACNVMRYGSTAYDLCNARRVSGARPVMSTETGWGSDPAAGDQVNEAVQAKYLARALLLHFAGGITRTYIYQLVDSGDDGFNAYGLLTGRGAEKPAFREIKALIATMRDAGTVAVPAALAFSVTGDTSDVRSLALQKSDGSYRLVLWIEQPGFDPLTKKPIAVAAKSVTLKLQSTHVVSIATFQDDGTVRTSVPARADLVESVLALRDNLTVVEVAP